MKLRPIFETMIVLGLLGTVAALVAYGPDWYVYAASKPNLNERRLAVLFDNQAAYAAVVDGYQTGKTIGEVLDEVMKDAGEKP